MAGRRLGVADRGENMKAEVMLIGPIRTTGRKIHRWVERRRKAEAHRPALLGVVLIGTRDSVYIHRDIFAMYDVTDTNML